MRTVVVLTWNTTVKYALYEYCRFNIFGLCYVKFLLTNCLLYVLMYGTMLCCFSNA